VQIIFSFSAFWPTVPDTLFHTLVAHKRGKMAKKGGKARLPGDEMKCGSNDMQTFNSPLPAGHAHPFAPFAFVELPIKCL